SLFCRGPEASSDSPSSKRVCRVSGVHFLCQSTSLVHALPSPTAVTTIAIQPTLAILNALPLGCLGLRYTTKPEKNRYLEATEATVPSFSRRHIYSFPGVRREGLAVIARLDTGAPWSAPAKFAWEAFNKEAADGGQFLQLRQENEGAAAGVFFEPLSHYEIRVTCPNWLVDRSGVPSTVKLAIHHLGRQLPSADGLTLMHSECLEESCEFILTSPAATSKLEVRVPPNFSVLPWKSLLGDQVFCLQAEDVTPEDIHGAQCQEGLIAGSIGASCA
ncbi:Vps13a, partial [Symbiodinium natans]